MWPADFPMPDLNLWRTIALAIVAVGQSCFVMVYSTFPWYKTFLGRALFYKGLMLAVLTDLFLVTRFWDFGGVDVLFVVLYTMLGVGVWVQFFAFLRVRYEGKQYRANPNGTPGRVSGNPKTLADWEDDAAEVSVAANEAGVKAEKTAEVASEAAKVAGAAATVAAKAAEVER